MSSSSSSSSYAKVVSDARAAYNTGKTRPVEWRKRQLKGMIKLLEENEKLICDALFKDLHKPKLESLACDIDFVKNEFIGIYIYLYMYLFIYTVYNMVTNFI